MKSFNSLGIKKPLQRTLRQIGFSQPTEIQASCIPLILNHHNIIGCSRTGSGKTAAYLIPLIQLLEKHSETVGTRALLLLPNRELALQTVSLLKKLVKETDLRYSILLGGHDYEGQFESLSSNPDIVVASPGRLMELLEHTEFSFQTLEFLVIDEADYLFESQFIFQMNKIFSQLNRLRQTLMFSATIPDSLETFARSGTKEFRIVKLDSEFSLSPSLEMDFFVINDADKKALLVKLLREEVIAKERKALVFVATHYRVEEMEQLLKSNLNLGGTKAYLIKIN
jgi:ATP-dependent RNA helicase DDX54/DBP10